MTNLITMTDKTPIEALLQIDADGTVSAKKLYEFLELEPKNYARWSRENIRENQFAEENIDFTPFVIMDERNPKPTTDYRLSVEFAKKLCMIQKNERGEQARDYFVKVEKAHKETQLALSGLSPQLQLLISMELKQTEMEKQLASVQNALITVKDTIISRDDDWRRGINKMFNSAVEATGSKGYQALRQQSYIILEERAHCDLSRRLNNWRERLAENGATKQQINATTKLDVIENDPRLKEIYTAIIKEFSIRYSIYL